MPGRTGCGDYSDSRLVVYQIQGSFEAWDSQMKAYLSATKQIIIKFGTVKVAQVGRAQNRHADSLATLASSMTKEVPRLIKVELIREPSIDMEDNRVGWTRSLTSWLRIEFRTMKKRPKRFVGWLPGIGCRQIANCTEGLLEVRTFYAYIPRK